MAEASRTGRPSIPYLILLRGGLAKSRVVSDAPVGSYPAFSLSPARATCFLWRFPSHGISPRPSPIADESPALWSPDFPLPFGSDRFRRASLQGRSKSISRGRGCDRTSCRPRDPSCDRRAARRSAAAQGGIRRTRPHASAERRPATASCAAARSRA